MSHFEAWGKRRITWTELVRRAWLAVCALEFAGVDSIESLVAPAPSFLGRGNRGVHVLRALKNQILLGRTVRASIACDALVINLVVAWNAFGVQGKVVVVLHVHFFLEVASSSHAALHMPQLDP